MGRTCRRHDEDEKYTKNTTKYYSENLKGRNRLRDGGVAGRIILKLILNK
jgi:hypothetical protein